MNTSDFGLSHLPWPLIDGEKLRISAGSGLLGTSEANSILIGEEEVILSPVYALIKVEKAMSGTSIRLPLLHDCRPDIASARKIDRALIVKIVCFINFDNICPLKYDEVNVPDNYICCQSRAMVHENGLFTINHVQCLHL